MSIQTMDGIAASAGVAIGKAFLFSHEEVDIPIYEIDEAEVDGEIERYRSAVNQTRRELEKIREKSRRELSEDHAQIFSAHLLILKDPLFSKEIPSKIETLKINAEQAVREVSRRIIGVFSDSEDELIQGRIADIQDISKRLIHHLLEKQRVDLSSLDEKVIVIAHDLSPSDTALLDKGFVLGFATDVGSRTSHTAIMARALEIPAVVGTGNISSQVHTGDTVILDGIHGRILINPTAEVIEEYKITQRMFLESERVLSFLRDLPAETRDGHYVELSGNIEIPEELDSVLEHGARGIGLYRTEFLYIRHKSMPSEDEQYEFYRDAAERIAPEPVIIRTVDLGGDKFASYLDFNDDADSFLGLRGIRFCLYRQDIFIQQLRAILRASVHGNLKIMFPMVTDIDELILAKKVLSQAKHDLTQSGTPFNNEIEVGVMIEVPSAALTADVLAREADFFSIGTNDLIQYALGVHRVNEEIAYLYEPLHPAILRLIQLTAEAAQRHGIWVGMCGEMAGELIMVPLLLGLGMNELSMSPTSVPEVKKLIRSLTIKDAQEIKESALSLSSASEVRNYLYEEARQRFPESMTWIEPRPPIRS